MNSNKVAQICHYIRHCSQPNEHDEYILRLKSLHDEFVCKTRQLRLQIDQERQLLNTKYFALQCTTYEKNIVEQEKTMLVQYPSKYIGFLQSLENDCNPQYKDELLSLLSQDTALIFEYHYAKIKSFLLKELQNRVQMMEKVQLLEKQKNLLLEQQNRQNQYWSEFKQACMQFYQAGTRLSKFVNIDRPMETEEGEFLEASPGLPIDSQDNSPFGISSLATSGSTSREYT